MNLTLDIPFSEQNSALLTDQVLAKLLGLGDLSYLDIPLEAQLAHSFGLTASPDFPLAAVSAKADGIDVAGYYWLRADAVHLAMQRDAFSLSEPVPLALTNDETSALLATINQHFAEDGLFFVVGNSGQWYVRLQEKQMIETILPAVAINQNVHDVMPKGQDGAKWRTIFNDLQMLFHEHAVNLVRESQKKLVINSLWFSGGGTIAAPQPMSNKNLTLIADSVLYQGLALLANLPFQSLQQTAITSDFFASDTNKYQDFRLALSAPTQADFVVLLSALKARRIKTLTIHIGFYAHTLALRLTPNSLFRCWRIAFWQKLFNRKARPLLGYLERLNSC